MPIATRRARLAATVFVSLLALPLASCAGLTIPGQQPPSSGSSSTPGAGGGCQVATEAINQVIADAQAGVPQLIERALSGQSLDAAGIVDPVLQSLDEAARNTTDPAVLKAIDGARAEWDQLAADIQALKAPDLSGIDLGNLGSLSQLGGLQEYGTQLSALFTERLPALQKSGQKLQQACAAQ
ncbi:hypothetical protein [Leucobacter sp. wl10]|uniref:hypothetical protein n=1 Tax=Leucobacter sp. wl10 TaxID=2304677 RepID=UPI000E5BE413|nr:hypothetical protein [Leucobacter sp. wl10]RGE24361.1 hypothetical protein D1J51_01085 [Leucobacter sp. wl10]